MKITLYQDTYCPWCYVGKKNLEAAIEQYDGDVKVEYRSFFLNPNLPKEGMDAEDYIGQIYERDYFDQMQARLVEMGRSVGIDFKTRGLNSVVPNTELSHRLAKLYPDKKEQLIQRYYESFFEEGRNIGEIDELLDIAEGLGIDKEEARVALETGAKRDEVWADYRRAQRIGVRGVPFFVFNDELALQGAHPPEIILQAMRRVHAREELQLDMVDQE